MHWTENMCSYYDVSLNELARKGKVPVSSLGTWKKNGKSLDEIPYKYIENWAKSFNTQPAWLMAMFR